jgi:hypothetical protein
MTNQEAELQAHRIASAVNDLTTACHDASRMRGWWHDADSGASLLEAPLRRYAIPTKIALIHSEASEGLEGDRCQRMDDKLPHHPMLACELADVIIRACDLGGALGYKLGDVIREKMGVNAVRADHGMVARRAPGGKAY